MTNFPFLGLPWPPRGTAGGIFSLPPPLANRPSQRVLGLTWRPRRISIFVDQKPEEISKNDGNTI